MASIFTGGDIITARALYKEYFEFQPAFVVFMTTNALPVIDGADAALGRRVVLVPFRNVIGEEDRDKGLPAKLRAEASGIFNRLLQGLADYRRVGLAIPEDLKAEAADYTETSDMIAAFLVAEYDTAPGENVGARLLYMTYQQWCGENGLRPMSQPQFRPEMIKKLGYAPKKTNAGAIWPGLRGRKPTI